MLLDGGLTDSLTLSHGPATPMGHPFRLGLQGRVHDGGDFVDAVGGLATVPRSDLPQSIQSLLGKTVGGYAILNLILLRRRKFATRSDAPTEDERLSVQLFAGHYPREESVFALAQSVIRWRMDEQQTKKQKYRWMLILLLFVASGEFIVRGPVRFLKGDSFNDFVSPYIQSRAWMGNMDPYSPATLVRLWPRDATQFIFLKEDLADGDLVLKRGIPTAYPLTTYVLVSPFAALPWHLARVLWIFVSLAAFAAAVLSLSSLLGFRWPDTRTFCFLAFALALAPFHTGLAAGSIVIVAVGVSAAAVLAANRGWDSASGILICVASGLKPQIGLPILVFYLLRKRWRVAIIAAALLTTLALVGASVLMVHGTPWLDSYKSDNRMLFAKGSLGDYTEANPIRFSLINLQVLLYTFWPDRTGANFVSLVLVSIVGFVWLFLFLRCKWDSDSELLALSALLVLSLLPVYHRLYDATLLIFPLAWSLHRARHRGVLATATAAVILVFLFPGGSMAEVLQKKHPALQESWYWMHFAMPHQVWTLLLLCLLLLMAMKNSARTVLPPH